MYNYAAKQVKIMALSDGCRSGFEYFCALALKYTTELCISRGTSITKITQRVIMPSVSLQVNKGHISHIRSAVMLSLLHYMVASIKLIQKRGVYPAYHRQPSNHPGVVSHSKRPAHRSRYFRMSLPSVLLPCCAATSSPRLSR